MRFSVVQQIKGMAPLPYQKMRFFLTWYRGPYNFLGLLLTLYSGIDSHFGQPGTVAPGLTIFA